MLSWIAASILFLVSTVVSAKTAKQVHLVTFELPPFVKEDLPEGGAAIAAFRELFLKQGYELKVTFAPVIRAKKQAIDRDDVVGYFPAVAENLQKNFILSRTVHQSTWSLAESTHAPIIWKSISDLKKYRIGNVVGYDLAGVLKPVQKDLMIEEANSDELNLLKVAKGRLDMAFVDSTVFYKLLQNSEQLRPVKSKLQLNPRPLQVYKYAVAFKSTIEGKESMRVFNSAFSELEFQNSVEAYLRKHKAVLP